MAIGDERTAGEWTIHAWRDQKPETMSVSTQTSAIDISLFATLNKDYWTEAITGPDGTEIRRPELSELWRSRATGSPT